MKYFWLTWSLGFLIYSLICTIEAFNSVEPSTASKVFWVVMDLLWIESTIRRVKELDEGK